MKCLRQAFQGSGRIFMVVLALVSIMAACLLIGSSQPALAQEEAELGDYRSSVATGNWNDTSTWQVYDGTNWVPADYYPGQNPGDYTVTIMSGNVISDNNVGTLSFGNLIVYGHLSLSNDLTLNTTDYVLVDGQYYDGSNIDTGGAIYWNWNGTQLTLSLPENARLDVTNVTDTSGQVIVGLGLYAPHAANNNMRLRIGEVEYAAAEGGGNVVFTFLMVNEAEGVLAANATAEPAELDYQGSDSPLTTTLTGNATGLGSDPQSATLLFSWNGTGPGSFTFSFNGQNPGSVTLYAGAGTYTFTLTVTSTYKGFTYSTSDDAIVTVNPAPLTVTGITGVNKIYDGTTAATVNSSGAELVGVIPPDDVTLDASGATATFGDKNVGSSKTVTVMGLSLTGADAGNYTLIPPTTTADITRNELTITANDQTKVQGKTFTFDGTEFGVAGLKDGDSVTSVTLTSIGQAADATVGTYAIVASAAVGTGLENYDINYVDGTLTVKAGGGGLPWWAILLIVLAAAVVVYFAVRYIRKRRQAQSD